MSSKIEIKHNSKQEKVPVLAIDVPHNTYFYGAVEKISEIKQLGLLPRSVMKNLPNGTVLWRMVNRCLIDVLTGDIWISPQEGYIVDVKFYDYEPVDVIIETSSESACENNND